MRRVTRTAVVVLLPQDRRRSWLGGFLRSFLLGLCLSHLPWQANAKDHPGGGFGRRPLWVHWRRWHCWSLVMRGVRPRPIDLVDLCCTAIRGDRTGRRLRSDIRGQHHRTLPPTPHIAEPVIGRTFARPVGSCGRLAYRSARTHFRRPHAAFAVLPTAGAVSIARM